MKVLRKLLLVGLVGAMFAACSKDLETVDPIGPVDSEQGETVAPVSVGLFVPGMTAPVTVIGAQTRAEVEEAISVSVPGESEITRAGDTSATTAENAVKNLWILQFNGSGNLAFKELRENVDVSKALEVSLLGFDNTTVYAIANVGKTKFENTTVGGLTLTQLEAMKFETTAEVTTANGLPMIGSWTGQTKDPSQTTGQPKIQLKRLVAKISFTCTKNLPSGHSFTLKSVQLRSVSPETVYKAPAAGTKVPADNAKFFDYAVKTTSTLGTWDWYVPENLRGTNTSISLPTDKGETKAPAHSTYFEMKGDYNDGSTVSEVVYKIFPGENDKTDFNIKRNYKYTIAAEIKGCNYADSRVIVAVDLSKNPFTKAVETANSYMVSQAGRTYKFKATVMGNGATTAASSINGQSAPAITPVALAPQSVKVLWETSGANKIIKSVELKDGWVYLVTAGEIGDPVTEGNAVIAVYSSATAGNHMNVLWSWHIWSTAYNATTDFHSFSTNEIDDAGYNTVPDRTEKFMTRNLGAANTAVNNISAYGLLYQWGRKDPFVGSAATSGTTFVTTYPNSWPIVASSATTSGTGATPQDKSINYAISHPTTFITQINRTTYDWVNAPAITNQRDNLWGNPNKSTQTPNPERGSKSIYDPCPPGWRVAPQDAWTSFTLNGINTSVPGEFNVDDRNSFATNKGWIFNPGGSGAVKPFYPAAGLRYRETGALAGVGTYGYYWSSSSYAAGNLGAGFLDFGSGYVSPLDNSYRAYAFSVRCVQN